MGGLSGERSKKDRRPQLGWEDCLERDLRKTEEEEKRREKANIRDPWKITKVAVQRSNKWPASPLRNRKERKNKYWPPAMCQSCERLSCHRRCWHSRTAPCQRPTSPALTHRQRPMSIGWRCLCPCRGGDVSTLSVPQCRQLCRRNMTISQYISRIPCQDSRQNNQTKFHGIPSMNWWSVGLTTGRSRVLPLAPLRNFGNSVYPTLPVSFGGDTKSHLVSMPGEEKDLTHGVNWDSNILREGQH